MSIKVGEKALLSQAYPTDQWTLPEDHWVGFFEPHPEYFRDLDGDIMIEIERKLDGEPVYLEDRGAPRLSYTLALGSALWCCGPAVIGTTSIQ